MRRIKPTLLFCLLVLALGACRDSVVPEVPEPIVLAATVAETGRFSELGSEVARGYRLSVDMLNEMGGLFGLAGREVRLILRDDASDAQTSADIYAEYVSTDTIDALLGPYSSPITDAVVAMWLSPKLPGCPWSPQWPRRPASGQGRTGSGASRC